ncbi:hypothetical protein FB451DRAFT_1303927 [Mycena latifolia]|nr:hypothetical protein FB451DRAFT_1303927 [Mycena latifolia]
MRIWYLPSSRRPRRIWGLSSLQRAAHSCTTRLPSSSRRPSPRCRYVPRRWKPLALGATCIRGLYPHRAVHFRDAALALRSRPGILLARSPRSAGSGSPTRTSRVSALRVVGLSSASGVPRPPIFSRICAPLHLGATRPPLFNPSSVCDVRPSPQS